MRNLGYIASAVSTLFLLAAFKLSAEDNATLSAKRLEVIEYVVRFDFNDVGGVSPLRSAIVDR